MASAIGQLVVACIHIFDVFDGMDYCDDSNNNSVECVGESLFWEINGVDDTSSVLNGRTFWRSVFTFVPDTFCDIWQPVVFAVITCCQLFLSGKWNFICGNMLKGMLFHIIMALFACFGYAGKGGIVVGFIESAASFLCFICVCLRQGDADPWPTLNF